MSDRDVRNMIHVMSNADMYAGYPPPGYAPYVRATATSLPRWGDNQRTYQRCTAACPQGTVPYADYHPTCRTYRPNSRARAHRTLVTTPGHEPHGGHR